MRYGKIILIFMLTLTVMSGCKVKEAAGAYRPAKAKPGTEKKVVAPEPVAEVKKEPVRVERQEPKPKEVVKEEPKQLVESVGFNEPVVEEVKPEPIPQPEPTPEPVKEVVRTETVVVVPGQTESKLKDYNVVIGSFGSQINAQNLQQRMQPEYQPIVVVNEKGMYRVLLASFDDYASARALITRINTQFPDAWVLIAK